jgi:hypothetical protein
MPTGRSSHIERPCGPATRPVDGRVTAAGTASFAAGERLARRHSGFGGTVRLLALEFIQSDRRSWRLTDLREDCARALFCGDAWLGGAWSASDATWAEIEPARSPTARCFGWCPTAPPTSALCQFGDAQYIRRRLEPDHAPGSRVPAVHKGRIGSPRCVVPYLQVDHATHDQEPWLVRERRDLRLATIVDERYRRVQATGKLSRRVPARRFGRAPSLILQGVRLRHHRHQQKGAASGQSGQCARKRGWLRLPDTQTHVIQPQHPCQQVRLMRDPRRVTVLCPGVSAREPTHRQTVEPVAIRSL